MAEETLILVPGLLCTEALFAPQVSALADLADIRVTRAQREADTLGAIAEAILAEAPERFALAGLSFGGYVTFELLRRAPERITRVCLMDTTARSDTPERAALRRQFLEQARAGRFLGVTDRLLPNLIHPDRLQDARLTGIVKQMALDVGPEAFERQQTAILARPDSRPDLSAIAVPSLVLCGRQDVMTPLEAHEEMAAGIEGARLAVIEDCGHLSTIERPEAVNAELRAWLQA